MRIVAFVGYPLSGKTTAAEIARSMGIPVVVMGDVVREEAIKRKLPMNNENLGKIAEELRRKYGKDAIAVLCLPKIRDAGAEKGIVVVDGVRSIEEVERFKKEFGDDFLLIAIECPEEIRLERAKKRMRSDDMLTIDELRARDRREESWGLKDAMEMANYTIENIGDIKDFEEKIKALMSEFLKYVEILIETDIHPTESEEKVVNAVKNIFSDAEVKIERGKLTARAKDLNSFRELLRRQKILDTARSELTKGKKGDKITIYLNKQTATVSKINFTEEDATLSPIKVTFRLQNVSFIRFLDYVAPETKDGKPLKEVESL
ncbi:MAG: AAA family ATPase [Archaeoglobales archaeon]|nr:AAA family ATPase [Archaeoglobales archaeon]